MTDQSGHRRVDIPSAEVSLSLYQLLFGRIAPRAIAVDRAQLTLLRAADGALSLDLGSLAEATDNGEPAPPAAASANATPVADLLAELSRPPTGDRSHGGNALLSQLRVVRIRDARVAVVDRQLGITVRAAQAEIDLNRRPAGGMEGTADLNLTLGEQKARLTMSATLAAGASETHLRARLTPVTPATLAPGAPALAVLAALNAPVGSEADLDLDARLAVRQARLTLSAGAGEVRIRGSTLPISDAVLVAEGTPDSVSLQTLQLDLLGHPGAQPTRVDLHGTLQREAGRVSATLAMDLGQADFADLGRLWPEAISPHARAWLVENIPAGTARNGHVDLALEAPQDLSSVVLARASGTLDGDGLQVYWLRPVPPIDKGTAQLRIVDPDTLEIVVASGRQLLRGQKDTSTGGLLIRGGRMRITGMSQRDQVSTIDADVTGSVPDALALLREPRLAMLDRHPIDLKNPAGQATMKLTVGLPLERTLRMDDITIHVQGKVEGVHLGAIAAGRDLDQGVLDLDATSDGLKINGRALVASIPVRLDVAMDFRNGPPTQAVQTVTASGQPDARQLAAAGLDATSVVSGPLGLRATLTERRNGQGDLAISADLTPAELAVEALEWRKPRDRPAKASVQLVLDHDRLAAINDIQLDGDGVAARGRADVRDGRVTLLHLDRLVLGQTVAQGTVRLPDPPGTGAIVANIAGSTLDLSARLSRSSPVRRPPLKAEPPRGPPWSVEARFDRALMAHDEVISQLAVSATNDGRVVQRLSVEGRTGASTSFLAQIAPEAGGRQFTVGADDAGQLLRGLDLVRTMQGGRLSVRGHYDDAQLDRPLSGTATIEDFRIRNAPALGKLLQAMTLYGLVEVMQGPGLGFNRLIAPFRLTDDTLDLSEARAFSTSLGLTAKGRINLDTQAIDMQGTIVPAYFFNSLLGNIPVLGKLFSPERGGGLFAASYTLRGPLNDPEVFVNPLTALTPGFLRGLFGIF